MSKKPTRAAWLLATGAAIWAPLGTDAFTIPMHEAMLFDRSSSDCSSNFSPCSQAGLPSNFCCSSDTTCDVLAANTTIVCCPSGRDCSTLSSITCDITLQDADLHPDAPIKTTALHGSLPKCNNGYCCPFGYSCNSKSNCERDSNQNASPIQSSPTASSTAKSTSTSSSSTGGSFVTTPVAASSAAATTGVVIVSSASPSSVSSTTSGSSTETTRVAASQTNSAAPTSSGGGPSTGNVVGGVIGSVAGVALLVVAVWYLWGRHMQKKRNEMLFGRKHSRSGSSGSGRSLFHSGDHYPKINRSTSSFGNIIANPLPISSPKPQGNASAFRTDFIRKHSVASNQRSSPNDQPVTPPSARGIGIASSTGSTTLNINNISPLSATAIVGKVSGGMPTTPPRAATAAMVAATGLPGRNISGSQRQKPLRDSISVTPIRSMKASVVTTGSPKRNPSLQQGPARQASHQQQRQQQQQRLQLQLHLPEQKSRYNKQEMAQQENERPITQFPTAHTTPGPYAARPVPQRKPSFHHVHPQREPSTENINVGVDPSIMMGDQGFPLVDSPLDDTAADAYQSLPPLTPPQRRRSRDRMTTFSGMMEAANLDINRPFVPGSIQSTPASRLR